MQNDDHWNADRDYERDLEREPTFNARRLQRIPLIRAGTLRQTHEDAQRRRGGGGR